MQIGWANRGYPVVRTILGKVPGIGYIHSRSYASAISSIARRVGLPCKGFLKFGASFIGGTQSGKVDLYHFFNQIGVGLCRKPFVTTFETSLPRCLNAGDYWYSKSIEAMVSSRCKKLIALSHCTREIQLRAVGVPDVADRLTVLHPPQDILITAEEMKNRENHRGALKFFFVGRDFFRKGGGEILRALVELRKSLDIELTLVGDISRHDYLDLPGVDDTDKHLAIIWQNSEWIHHFITLPNDKVLELMKTCDVGLLPTRADTYGYSVLEMQACGLPVITTDVRALPEINNDDCGWVINGCGIRDGTQGYGEADYSSPGKLRELSEKIENGIYKACAEIASKPESVFEKGICALARIQRDHDPIKYGDSLATIYKEALS